MGKKRESLDFVTYKCKDNEKIEDILYRFKLTMNDLTQLNPKVPKYLTRDTIIRIPLINKDKIHIYVSPKYDSLWNVAKIHQVSVEFIKRYNRFRTDFVEVGDVIVIPIHSSPQITKYNVKDNETIQDIVKKNNISILDLINDNRFIVLSPNQQLTIRR